MMLGISIREKTGVGDKVQFSSLPENYFRATGKKLIDVSRTWIFDHNPYVDRDTTPTKVIELWNWPKAFEWPRPPRDGVYLSNAEIWALRFGVPATLIRPRLYQFEDFPFAERRKIVFHAYGKSNGMMPDSIIEHVLKKYGPTGDLIQLCGPGDPPIVMGIPSYSPTSLWDCARFLSDARMFIGVDSGPSWIAACFPDIITKKVRIKFPDGEKEAKDWIPLEVDAHHSHWDDRLFSIHNITEDDVGFMPSYKRL